MSSARSLATAVAVGLLLTACGGDDVGDAPGVTAVASTTTSGPATTVADGVDDLAYCQAHLAFEAALNAEDPAAAGPAIAAARSVAPTVIADALEITVAAGTAHEGPPSAEFSAAYGDLLGWVRAHCGFADVGVSATDYAFGGLAAQLAAGPTVVQITNTGTEFHEVAIVRRNDGVTESFDDLLALPEDQFGEMVTFVGAAFAAPGETGAAVVDLPAGDYLAVCFVPIGATPDVVAAGGPPDGPPHFMQGMGQQFAVV